MSKGKLPQNMQSRSEILQSCSSKSKEVSEDVEIIDLDNNTADADVEIIDVDQAGTSRQGAKFIKKERGNSPNYVISIDDDDDDDDDEEEEEEDEQNDETGTGSHVRYGNNSRNRYGLDVTSESESFTDDTSEEESTDGESSDCEMIDEEASGRIREEWERANSRKRNSDLNKVFGDAFDDNFGDKIGSFCSSGLDKDKDKDKAGPSCSVPKPQEVNFDPVNNGLDDNVGEKIGSFYSTGLDRDKAGPSCSVPKPEESSLNPVNNPIGRESVEKDGEFENFNPSMFFEDELNKVVDSVCGKEEAKETKFEKQFGMSSCSDNKGKGVVCESEDAVVKKEMRESCLKEEDAGESPKEREECLIGDREKHKESEEYRLAAEAEWASRQEQLRIQAEEAQRLKRESKRRKAQSMRLLDMKKRQKQRLHEIRETHKKNEETMSLKEELRAKVRKDLEIIERKYRDMPSILRGLGIPVSGGLSPLPTEIKAAYKQALLRFHPDRVQTSDIRQLVQAEETFKFISRFKDKLLPAS